MQQNSKYICRYCALSMGAHTSLLHTCGLHIVTSLERVHYGKGERIKSNFTVEKPDKLFQPGYQG